MNKTTLVFLISFIILLALAAPAAYVGLSLWLGMTAWQILAAFLISTVITFAGLGIASLLGKEQAFNDHLLVIHLVALAAGTAFFIDPLLAVVPAAAVQLISAVVKALIKATYDKVFGR